MKIVYLANVRLPTEKAHGAQIMKMCEAFGALGHEVELVVTDRATPITEDPFAYYGVQQIFSIRRIAVPDTVRFGMLGFIFQSWVFARRAQAYVRKQQPDLIYGRDEFVLARLSVKPIVWESHTGAWNRAARIVAARAKCIVAISLGLKDFYVERGVPAEKILVAHDGVDLSAFANPEPQAAARGRLGLPLDKKIAMYIGRFDGWKGVETFFKASEILKDELLFAAIGGEPRELAALRARYTHMCFLGPRPYRELPDNQAAADVLVLPNTSKSEISARFTSPLKLFTYMASGVPILAADLPSIREVLDDEAAYFFAPDDAQSLADIVRAAIGDPAAPQRALRARSKVEAYTWSKRAERILLYVSK